MECYKRIALLGALGNPNLGDEAILEANLQRIRKIYGDNCKVYVFTKDASYTSLWSSFGSTQIISVDYLHDFTVQNHYDIEEMKAHKDELLNDSVDNKQYSALHEIFKEIDILHCVGGGYINSLWPDMLYEVYLATLLAKKYSKKYIFTGISIFPFPKDNISYLQEMFDGAEFVDFRDDSYQSSDLVNKNTYLSTIDDAVKLETIYPDNSNEKYATLAFHDWRNKSEEIINMLNNVIVPFMETSISNSVVSSFKILGFSEGDLEIWNEVKIPEALRDYVVFYPLYMKGETLKGKHLVGNALFNLGSRFHQAVFSLSSSIPVFSVYYDDYYQNKLNSIHKQFNSDNVCRLDDITLERLNQFVDSLSEIKKHIDETKETREALYKQKEDKIISAYEIADSNAFYRNAIINKKTDCPKISVIIPIYNKGWCLKECLDTVLSQTLTDIEVLCLNDGSSDNSINVITEYAYKDNRVVVVNKENEGVAATRNLGIKMAKGEFVFFLDPDDWLPDNKVFEDLYVAAKENHVLICGGGFSEYNNDVLFDKYSGFESKYNFKYDALIQYKDYSYDYGWTRFIYNREFLINNNLYLPSLTFFEDPVFFVKVMDKAGCFYGMKRKSYCYRTGYKSSELSKSKVIDLLNGLLMNISLAKDKGYDQLLELEKKRVQDYFAMDILKYLNGKDNADVRELIEKINEQLYNGNNRVEYAMYEFALYLKQSELEKQRLEQYEREKNMEYELKNQEIVKSYAETINEIYQSSTWKLGNILLYIPKKIKELLGGKHE